jgi:hypothetical protein
MTVTKVVTFVLFTSEMTHNPKHNGSKSPIDALCYVIVKLYEVSYGVGKNYRRATANKHLVRVF